MTLRRHPRAFAPFAAKGCIALAVCALSVMAGLWTPFPAQASAQLIGFTVTPGGPVGPGREITPALASTPPAVYTEPLPPADVNSDSVGATPATFRVDESGASTYSVPIYTAPGTAGLGPSLSLEYNSRAANGPMGPGWSIGGLSAISRCKKATEFGDGAGPFPAINFDGVATDQAYCLDGARLLDLGVSPGLCPAGPSGNTAHVFGLELDPSTRVCGYTNATITGYAFWLVQPKDGSYRVYGVGGNAALQHNANSTADATQFLSWSLSRIADAVGNTVEYSYTQNTASGELDIASIAYTGQIALANVLVASPPFTRATYATIVFSYVTLPAASQRTDYVAGMKLALTKQLTAITANGPVNHGSSPNTAQVVRTYTLGYGTPTSSGLSALTSVQECAPNGSTPVCYPATQFQWNGGASPAPGYPTAATPRTYAALQYAVDYKVGDVDGDGRQDLVWVEDQLCTNANIPATQRFQIMVSLANSTGFASAIPSGIYLNRSGVTGCGTDLRSFHFDTLWFLYDFTGDGRDDLLASTGTGWSIYPTIAYAGMGGGYGFDSAHPVSTGMFSSATDDGIFADFNGDGLPDLIHVSSTGGITSHLLQKTTGAGALTFQFASTATPLSVSVPSEGTDVVEYALGFAPQPGRNQLNADLNGDGASDFILKLTYDTGTCGSGGGNNSIQNPINRTVEGVPYAFDPSSQPDETLALCEKHWWTFRNAGIQSGSLKFIAESDIGQIGALNLVGDGSFISLVDLNGDGQADLVYAKSSADGTSYAYYYRINAGKTADAATTERFLPEQSTGLTLPVANAEGLQFVDVNGDHRTDILYQDVTADSSGKYPFKALLWGQTSATGFGAIGIDVGNSTLNALAPSGARTFLIDVDGNGGPDLVSITGTSLNVSAYGPNLGGNDFVTQVSNGLGAITHLTYYPLAYSAAYQRAYDGPAQNWGRGSPVFDVFSSIWVVHEASSSAPTAAAPLAQSGVIYHYSGAKIQSGGRGFLGFNTVQSENQQPTQDTSEYLVTTTQYRQDFPFIGRAINTVVELETALQADPCESSPGDSCFTHDPPTCGSNGTNCNVAPAILAGTMTAAIGVGGQQLSNAQDVYTSNPAFVATTVQPVMPYLSSSDEQKFDVTSVGTLSHEITSAFVEDTYGNVTSSSVISSEPASTDETKTTTNTFGCTVVPPTITGCAGTGSAVNAELQRVGRLSISTVSSARSGQTTKKRRASFEYDATTRQRIADIQGPYDDLETAAVAKIMNMRTDLVRDGNGNVIAQVQCSTSHFANRAACTNLASFQQRGYDGTDPTKFQRYAKWDYDSLGRFEIDKKLPFYAAGASGNLNEGIAEQIGQTSSGINRDAFGNPLNRVNAAGNITNFVYGTLGRAYFSEDATGAFSQTTYAWCKDPTIAGIPSGAPRVNCPIGAIYRITTSSVASQAPYSNQSAAPTTWAYFDTLGREMLRTKRIYQPDSPTVSLLHWSSVATTYDSTGRTVTTSTPYFSIDPATTQGAIGTRAGTLQSTATAAGIATTTYDAVDRPTNQTHPEETANTPSASSWTFSELVTHAENPRGYTTTQTKNARNEVTQVTAPAAQANALTVTYGRNALGNITSVTRTPTDGNSAGNTITTGMGYDDLGRKTGMSDPDKGAWSYSYNALGEQVSQTDAKGQTQTLYHDALGRVYQRNETRQTGATYISEPTSTWEYDTAVRSTSTAILGALHVESDGIGGFSRTTSYDDIGRVAKVLTSEDDAIYYESQTYDQFGRPYQHFDPSTSPSSSNGELTVYSTDGYPIQTQEAASGTSGIVYDQVLALSQRGQVSKEEFHGATVLTTLRGYDANTGRMLSVSTDSGALQNWGYDYDKHSNLLHRANTATGYNLREDFTYDDLDRLSTQKLTVNGTAGTTLTASYDQLGNLLSKQSGSTVTYASQPAGCAQSAGPHAASAWNGNTYCYDANGNQISTQFANSQTRTITYTGYDLPAQIVTNGTPSTATESFSYAPDRSMFKRVEGVNGPSDRIFCSGFETTPCPSGSGPRTYYVGNVEVRIAGTTVTTKRYLGSYLVITTTVTGGTTTGPTYAYLFRDALGSIDVITNETGTVMQRQAFDAWGNRRDATPTGQWTILPPGTAAAFDTSTTFQGFTGHQQLDPVGLIHMRGRLYDPQLGRFIQADPMTEGDPTQGLNRYSYVLNNPMSLTDPSGYLSFRSIVGIAIGVAAAFFSGGLFLAGEYWASFAVATAGGFASAYVATGSLKAGLWGAFAAGVFWGIGSAFTEVTGGPMQDGSAMTYQYNTGSFAAHVAAHAAAGGVLGALQGGNFGSGFIAAGATEALSPAVEKLPSPARPLAAALVGGTVSKAVGGSFANGAETGLFQELFNQTVHDFELDRQVARWANGEISTEQLKASENPCYGSASPGACTAAVVGGVIAGVGLGFVALDVASLLSPEAYTAFGATAVLGHYPAYMLLGESMGAETFSIAPEVWGTMTETEQWAANQAFLDSVIARQGQFILATPLSAVRVGSYFAQEIQYILSSGYVVNEASTALVPGG